MEREQKVIYAQALAEKERRQFKKNPFKIIRDGHLKIKTIDSDYVTFKINPIQDKLLTKIEKLWNEEKPIRLVILKARREGVSTLVEAIIYCLTAHRENVNSYIVSKDSEQASTLFEMSKLYYEHMKETKPYCTPTEKKNNAKELAFDEIRSLIRVKSAKDATAGRGDTYHLAHLSEIAFYQNPSEMMTGLQQTVSDVPHTMIVLESTANGMGGYFYEKWDQAVKGESDWIPIFFSWFDFPKYTREFETEEEEIRLRQSLGKDIRYNEFEGEEDELIEKYGCNLRQLNWRRYAIRNKCDGSLDKFHQEYPAYPEQAFLVSGRPVFNIKILQKMRTRASKPLKVGYLRVDEGKPLLKSKITLEENPKGYLRIYHLPAPGRRYLVGGDAQKGRITNEAKKETDKCSLQVLDIRTLEEVAVWEGRIDADLLGVEAIKLARFYHDAIVGIELNDGIATVARMKYEGYFNLYQRTYYDQVEDKETTQLGWWTDAKSKLLMIGDLAKFIREWLGQINDRTTIQELMTYVYDDDGKTSAQEGCHDDHVVALAIAYQMAKSYFDIPDHVKKPEDIYGTFAYFEKQIELQDQPEIII